MIRDFSKEFRDICSAIDVVVPKKYEIKPIERLYNIHKRSLPVEIDKIVVFNVTEKEAKKSIKERLKSKIIRDNSDISSVVYYDIVPVDASSSERSAFYNDKNKLIKPV